MAKPNYRRTSEAGIRRLVPLGGCLATFEQIVKNVRELTVWKSSKEKTMTELDLVHDILEKKGELVDWTVAVLEDHQTWYNIAVSALKLWKQDYALLSSNEKLLRMCPENTLSNAHNDISHFEALLKSVDMFLSDDDAAGQIAAINVNVSSIFVLFNDQKKDAVSLDLVLASCPWALFHFAAQAYYALWHLHPAKKQKRKRAKSKSKKKTIKRSSQLDSRSGRYAYRAATEPTEPRCYIFTRESAVSVFVTRPRI